MSDLTPVTPDPLSFQKKRLWSEVKAGSATWSAVKTTYATWFNVLYYYLPALIPMTPDASPPVSGVTPDPLTVFIAGPTGTLTLAVASPDVLTVLAPSVVDPV